MNRVAPVAGVDPLGREREEEVAAGHQPRGLERRLDHLLGGPGIRRALEDDELAVSQRPGDFRGCCPDVGHVRVLGLAEGSRDTDGDHVGRRERREVRPCLEAAGSDGPPNAACGHIRHVGVTGSQARDPLPVDIDPGHVESRVRHRHRLGKADVAEADDGHARRVPLQLALESHPFSYAAG